MPRDREVRHIDMFYGPRWVSVARGDGEERTERTYRNLTRASVRRLTKWVTLHTRMYPIFEDEGFTAAQDGVEGEARVFEDGWRWGVLRNIASEEEGDDDADSIG